MLLLTLVVAGALYARAAMGPLQESMQAALALSDNQMALLQGPALTWPAILAAVPLGLLIDRRSRVRLLLIFAVLVISGSFLTAWASSFPLLVACRALIGFAVVATNTTALSLLADLYRPDQRGRATMVIAIAQFSGTSAAFALGGWLVTMAASNAEGWRSVMLWLTGPLLPIAMLPLVMREPPRSGIAVRNRSAPLAFAEIWSYRAVIAPVLVGVAIAEFVLGAVLVWAAPVLGRNFALSADRIGAVLASGLMLSGILGPMVGGALADLCQRLRGPRWTASILAGLAVLSAPTAAFGVLPEVGWANVTLVIFMTLVSAIAVMGTSLLTVVIPNELRGLCLAMLAGFGALMFGLAPVVVSLLSNAIGGTTMIGHALALAGAIAGMVGAAAFAYARPRLPLPAANPQLEESN